MIIQRRVFISGRVQGVGFRASTVQEAQKYPDLVGFVRNLADGRVEALIQGPEAQVLALIAWCGRGPFLAKVTGVEVKEEATETGLQRFRTERI